MGAATSEACPCGGPGDRDLRAKERVGVSERALAVLAALLGFHPEATLGAERLIAFPSNPHFALRAPGTAQAILVPVAGVEPATY